MPSMMYTRDEVLDLLARTVFVSSHTDQHLAHVTVMRGMVDGAAVDASFAVSRQEIAYAKFNTTEAIERKQNEVCKTIARAMLDEMERGS